MWCIMLDLKNIDKLTLGEWLSFWFETYKKPHLKKYSVRNIEQIIRLHTPLWLKQIPIQSITIFDIDRALSLIPLGRTRVYARQVWHSAFHKAESLGIINRNVLLLTDRIKYKKKVSRALTIEEQNQFLQRLEDSPYKWLFLFYLHTGVRRNEALTLEWKDIKDKDGVILIKGTKTDASHRFIVLTDVVRDILFERLKQAKKQGSIGSRVFPYRCDFVSKQFKKLCPEHHLHDLRHTFITRCAECGMNVNVCQQIVGHSSVDMTLNVYTHVVDDFKRKEMAKFTLFPKY